MIVISQQQVLDTFTKKFPHILTNDYMTASCFDIENFVFIDHHYGMDISTFKGLFNTEVYDPKICWCFYNGLVVEDGRNFTSRIGIGKIHIHAFDKVANHDQELCLI
jgi:hypothetical protein